MFPGSEATSGQSSAESNEAHNGVSLQHENTARVNKEDGDIGLTGCANTVVNSSASKGFLKDTTITLASRVLAIVVSIGIASATAWLLGPAGKGELAICLIFAQLLVLGLGFGVDMGCAYYAGSKREQLGTVLGTQIVAYAVTATTVAVLGIACLNSSLPFVQKVPYTALACAIAFALTQLFFVFMTVLFMGLGRITHYNIARIGNQAITLIFLLGACWVIPNVTVAVIAYVLGSLLAGIFLLLVLMHGGLQSRIAISWRSITACYRYGIKYYFGKLATLVDIQMGVIVIAMVGTTEQAGLFSAALGLASRLWILPETLNIVLLSRVLTEQTALVGLITRSCRVALILTAAAACLLAILSKPIVAIILSPAFLPAVLPLLIMLPGVLMGCITRVLISYFNGVGRPEYNSITLLIGLAINVTMMIVLLPRWGLLGAATAASVAYITEAILAMLLFTKLTGQSWRGFLPRYDDIHAIMILIRQKGSARSG